MLRGPGPTHLHVWVPGIPAGGVHPRPGFDRVLVDGVEGADASQLCGGEVGAEAWLHSSGGTLAQAWRSSRELWAAPSSWSKLREMEGEEARELLRLGLRVLLLPQHGGGVRGCNGARCEWIGDVEAPMWSDSPRGLMELSLYKSIAELGSHAPRCSDISTLEEPISRERWGARLLRYSLAS